MDAVASRSEERARDFATKYGIAKAYGCYEALLDDTSVDAVYIATPHRFHFEQILQCLEAGKAVLCEKPLTVNAKQAEEAFEVARQQNVFLMEAMWTPFLPIWQQVRSWLRDGRIGQLQQIQSSFGFRVPRTKGHRYLDHEAAGGVLLDMGVYNVALSLWLVGDAPLSVYAQGVLGETGVDENVSVSLQFANGVLSQFLCCFGAQLDNNFVLYGTEGKISIAPFFWDNGSATLQTGVESEQINSGVGDSGFEFEIAHVVERMNGLHVTSDVLTPSLTLDTLRTLDVIRKHIGLRFTFE